MIASALSRQQARRVLMAAQLLTAQRPMDLVALAEHLTFLQLDPTAVVAPNVDLVAWSRLGSSYQPEQLRHALEVDRTMFEFRGADAPKTPVFVMLRPMSDLALFWPEMLELRRGDGQVNQWLAANGTFRRRVLDQLRADGPLTSRDIPDTAAVPWQSSGWTDDRNVTQMLEFLASRGWVAVSGRAGKQRTWDLAERVYPPVGEPLDLADARAERDRRRLRSLGLARPKAVGAAGIPVTVDGSPGTWRLDPEIDLAALADGFAGRTAVLSPFDRLVHDRQRALDLLDFEFTLELYKPKAQRRWGFFVLPALHGDRLIGKLDTAADRAERRLVVHAAHWDDGVSRAARAAVVAELAQLAEWLGLDGVRLP